MTIDITPQQKKRLLRLAKIADGGELGIIQEINDLEDRIDELTVTQKGDKGDTGADGRDGQDGQDGVDGKDGKDGKDGRDGRDGRDGTDGVDGKDGSPNNAKEIRDKLESLKGDERLDKSAIKGLEEWLRDLASKFQGNSIVAGGVRLFRQLRDTPDSYTGQAGKVVTVNADEDGLEFTNAGGIATASNLGAGEGVFAQISSGDLQLKSLVAGSNISLASDATTITITATTSGGSDTWIQEDFTDDVDGSTSAFALSATPKVGSPFMVYMQGVRQRSTNYTVGGGNITFTFNPPAGTELLVDYIEA